VIENPFERLKQESPQEISLGVPGGDGGTESAATWLAGSAIQELSERLHALGETGATVVRTQGGRRFYAVGVELPILKREVNLLISEERLHVDRVSFSLGLRLLDRSGEFRLSDPPPRGLYVGVRVQRVSPEGTLDQARHDRVYDACLPLLQRTGHEDWHRRSGGDYWSIFRWCSRPSAGETARDVSIREYLEGLAALKGSCW
jgi:hypothetical protein